MSFSSMKFSTILFGMGQMLSVTARRYPEFRERLRERNFIAQIMARDEEVGRWYTFQNGRVKSRAGLHPNPDVRLAFKNAALGADLLTPPINWLDQINAQKEFLLTVQGDDGLANWFAQT